jgi:flagellar hook-associated protein 2
MSSAISSTPSSAAAATTPASTLITSTGIGSGLNINAIVSSLTTAYGAAQQTQLTNQQNSLVSQVSAFGTFTSAVDKLQSTLAALESQSQLAGYKATIADSSIGTATADSTAAAGSYQLAVQSLASAATLTSAAVTPATTTIGTGTLQIAVGGKTLSLTVDSTDNTLSGLATAINTASDNPGVSASVVTTSSGARLVLTGSATGAANAITVTESDTGGGLSALVSGLTTTHAATDAQFTINGYAATSASNVTSAAISGVTLDLQSVSASTTDSTTTPPTVTYTPTTITVAPDSSAAQAAIGNFVTALNATLTSIQTLTAYDPATKIAGPLNGNIALQSFQNQLQTILGKLTTGGQGGINSLADLGITANASGTYDSNTTTLANALSLSLAGVGNLLGGANGIATQIDSLVSSYTSPTGLLASINKGLQAGLQRVATQQTELNAQLATYSATLTAEYNAMDTAVAALKQTQTYLNAEFNPSANSSSGSSSSSSSNSSLGSGTLSTGG